jgi:tripartite-type tricarboxylate transporter receptor subunit TctC
MRHMRLAMVAMALAAPVLYAGTSTAQNYPTKPVRLVTSEIGGGTDYAARVVALGLSASLGQQAVVENRSTLAATLYASKAAADGYTLLVSGSSFSVVPLLEKTAYDPIKDFVHITLVARALHILVVHPSLPVKTVRDLIALAKTKPGQLNYAAGSIGSTPHLATELFKSMAGINLVRINYKGTGPAFNDLLAGQVQVMIPASGGAVPHIKSGRLRALAITGPQPSALFPGIPTVAASGLPGYEMVGMTGLVAPMGTPVAIVRRLNQDTVKLLAQEDAKQRFLSVGVEPSSNSPEEFTAMIKANMAMLGKVIKDAGIRNE